MNTFTQQTMDYPTTSQPEPAPRENVDSGSAPLLVTVEEAARLLGCGRSFAYNLVLSGQLPTVKLGRLRRVPVGELNRYIADRLTAA